MAHRGGRAWRWAALIAAFLVVHVALALIDALDDYHAPGTDVYGVYDYWVYQWQQTGVLVGVDRDWVYPILALVPILAAAAFGTDTGAYTSTWMLLVLVLDGVALVLLARRRMSLAWWWLGFTALLGPVALARLDTVALAVVIPGVLVLHRRPALAAALFTVAAWIKVWPATLVLAMLASLRRVRGVVVASAAVCAAVVAGAAAVGASSHLLSFVAAQSRRGIQVEAPVALPWVWLGELSGARHPFPLDRASLSFEVRGPGVAETAAVMGALLPIGVVLVLVAALVARRRGIPPEELLPITALALASTVVVLNKVGSPQYMTWLVAPVLLGLLSAPARFRFPAVVVLVLAGLTQLVYPWLYFSPIPFAVALTVRNGVEVVLLAWSLRELIRSARASSERPSRPALAVV